jgi:hypothetical protein
MEDLYIGSFGGYITEATFGATIRGKTKEKYMINIMEESLQRVKKIWNNLV